MEKDAAPGLLDRLPRAITPLSVGAIGSVGCTVAVMARAGGRITLGGLLLGATALACTTLLVRAGLRHRRRERELFVRTQELEGKVRDAAAEFTQYETHVRGLLDDASRRVAEGVRGARDASMAAERARQEFLANIGHELLTPLNAILAMSEVLLEGENDPARQDSSRIVVENGKHLRELLEILLDYTNIRSGGIQVRPGSFEIAPLLEEAIASVQAQAGAKEIALSASVKEGTPTRVVADRSLVRRVLGILVSNAVKFSDHGQVLVTASAPPPEDARTEVTFRVRDEGPGIAPDLQPRLFRPFARGDDSPARGRGGVGLGLAVAKALVEAMGGKIALEEGGERGTVFRFTVSVLVAPAAAPAAQRSFKAADARVLLVDDNLTFLRVLETYLSNWGCRTASVSSGSQALERLAKEEFDLVVMDLQMPEMDGVETARRIRERWPAPGGPKIVGMTAWGVPEDHERCTDAGMEYCFTKPYEAAALREALEPVLRHGGAAPAGGGDTASGETASGDTDDAVDLSFIAGLRKLGNGKASDLATQVIDLFFEDAGKYVGAYRAALEAGDRASRRAAAHSLRTSSGTVGATALLRLCKEAEEAPASTPPEEEARLLARMEEEFGRVRATLARERRP